MLRLHVRTHAALGRSCACAAVPCCAHGCAMLHAVYLCCARVSPKVVAHVLHTGCSCAHPAVSCKSVFACA
eukprot:4768757-Alexandrium_andersonii.AAC.1